MIRTTGSAMRPIRLPEPPCVTTGIPDIFEGGVNVVRRAIVIGNGFSGAENQSIGLVRALGLADKLSIYRVTRPRGGVNEWLHWLPLSLHKVLDNLISQIFGNSAFGMLLRGRKLDSFCVQNGGYVGLSSILEADATKIATIARETFEKEGPLLVVASSQDTISAASSIKRLASENVFVIQIQHPRSGLDRFDLVVTPRHDYYALTASGQQEIPRIMRRWITPREPPGKNVVVTVGALHQADYAALRVAATIWHDELAPLPKPLLVVNVGGPTRNCKYTSKLARQLVGSLQNVLASCGSVRISFSRRTPGKVSEIILRELGGHPKIYIWDGEDPNPHMGHLAWADAFIITADSISLVSEACSIGKPVYVIGSEHCKWKFSTFHKTLCERGLVRPFTGLEDDPYHGAGQAMGLAFSVPESVKIPSSLINIFKELQEDLGCSVPLNGNLERWAAQGVLLLNTVLTVRNHQANSHAKKGWEPFTDAIIRTISQKKSGAVFLLWGISAQVKARMIDGSKHHILMAAHPSGLSANKGFFGCRHFSQTNQILEKLGLSPIDWQL